MRFFLKWCLWKFFFILCSTNSRKVEANETKISLGTAARTFERSERLVRVSEKISRFLPVESARKKSFLQVLGSFCFGRFYSLEIFGQSD